MDFAFPLFLFSSFSLFIPPLVTHSSMVLSVCFDQMSARTSEIAGPFFPLSLPLTRSCRSFLFSLTIKYPSNGMKADAKLDIGKFSERDE